VLDLIVYQYLHIKQQVSNTIKSNTITISDGNSIRAKIEYTKIAYVLIYNNFDH